MVSWYAEGAHQLEWSLARRDLLRWILRRREAGWYGVALMCLQQGFAPYGKVNLPQLIADIERSYIEDALAYTGGNVTKAADQLGLLRTTLKARINVMGLTSRFRKVKW